MPGIPLNMRNSRRASFSSPAFNIIKSRTDVNSKRAPTVFSYVPGKHRPDHNKQYNLAYYDSETNKDPNAFRARPIKHWRKQYGNKNTVSANRYLLESYDRPGGFTNTKNNNICKDCSGTVLTYPNSDIGKINKTGRFAPHESTYYEPYQKCVSVCDIPYNARKLIQYPSYVNTDPTKPIFYQTSKAYLRSRCKLFEQKQFYYTNPLTANIQGLPYKQNYQANCTPTSTQCKTSHYKPSNIQFAQQGAVDSSSRILRLKLNTINKAANFSDNGNFNLGEALPNAFAYSGRPEAPYTIKAKFNNCSKALYARHPAGINTRRYYKGGTGSRVTSCFRNEKGNTLFYSQRQSPNVFTYGTGSPTRSPYGIN